MQPFISIIIPLYNGEQYIEKCLDSVRMQQYSPIEIIVVDDASPDGSMDVIEKYGEKHGILVENTDADSEEKEVKTISDKPVRIVVVHQKNQGQGAARNTGIRHAGGGFLTFLDQDDTLEPGILVKMAEIAMYRKADIVTAGYRRVTADGKTKQEVKLQQTEWSKYKVIAPWAKLYRTDFIKNNGISFLPVVLGEDIYFLMQAYSYKPKVDFLEDIGYNWLDNENSVSNTVHKALSDETSLLKLYGMLEMVENNKVLKEDKLYEYFLLKTAIWDILYTARSNDYQTVRGNSAKVWNWFEQHMENYKKNPFISPIKPRGESRVIRLIIWGYMKLKKWRMEKILLWLISK